MIVEGRIICFVFSVNRQRDAADVQVQPVYAERKV